MKTFVKVVAHPVTGLVITVNANKPEYGSIRLDQEVISMENGFINKAKRTDFLAGKIEDLKSLGYTNGQLVTGKIVRTESFEPMYAGQSPKINPTTGKEVLINGSNVYFEDTFTQNDAKQDFLVSTSQAEVAKSVSANLAD